MYKPVCVILTESAHSCRNQDANPNENLTPKPINPPKARPTCGHFKQSCAVPRGSRELVRIQSICSIVAQTKHLVQSSGSSTGVLLGKRLVFLMESGGLMIWFISTPHSNLTQRNKLNCLDRTSNKYYDRTMKLHECIYMHVVSKSLYMTS